VSANIIAPGPLKAFLLQALKFQNKEILKGHVQGNDQGDASKETCQKSHMLIVQFFKLSEEEEEEFFKLQLSKVILFLFLKIPIKIPFSPT
jgi:hypothetical protein